MTYRFRAEQEMHVPLSCIIDTASLDYGTQDIVLLANTDCELWCRRREGRSW